MTTLLGGLMNSMQAADVPPTAITVSAITSAHATVMTRWTSLKTVDLAAVNRQLTAAGAAPLILD